MLNQIIAVDNAIKKKSGALRLAGLDVELKKIFTLMKLNKVLTICTTVDEAVKSIK
jgi:anti-anti-sigma regulatory factor